MEARSRLLPDAGGDRCWLVSCRSKAVHGKRAGNRCYIPSLPPRTLSPTSIERGLPALRLCFRNDGSFRLNQWSSVGARPQDRVKPFPPVSLLKNNRAPAHYLGGDLYLKEGAPGLRGMHASARGLALRRVGEEERFWAISAMGLSFDSMQKIPHYSGLLQTPINSDLRGWLPGLAP